MLTQCKNCGKEIKRMRKGATGLCSECWLNSIRNDKTTHRKIKLCPICKEVMIGGSSKSCVKCMGLLMKGKKIGADNPSWKGGRRISSGYIRIKAPQHPRADKEGYVAEHILVWEETHGQRLPEGWIVHHLNGIRYDNRPPNLLGLPDKKHRRLLQAKAKRIQELEAMLNNQHQFL